MVDVFSEQLDAWRRYTETPWARLRYAVVGEILRREAERLAGPAGEPLRVLDVGGGDGLDSLPLARAGHDVTILDQSRSWLDEAGRRAGTDGATVRTVLGDLADPPDDLGGFDLVLCHYVLQYRPVDAPDLATLVGWVRPGGLLSVVLPNPAAMVLRQLLTDGPAAALSELHAEAKHTVVFDHDVRKLEMAAVEQALGGAGLEVVGRVGLRVANDLVVSNEPKHDPAYSAQLLDLELALCEREPFCRIGGGYQLLATRS